MDMSHQPDKVRWGSTLCGSRIEGYGLRFLTLALSLAAFGGGVGAGNELYKKYEPADSRPVPKEGVDWNRFISNIPDDASQPKVLMIGDSICGGLNDSCPVPVQAILGDTAYVAYWFSSKACTDPDYIRALSIALEQYEYDMITFNNGLHGHGADEKTFSAAYENTVDFIRAKCPKAKLMLVTSTFLRAYPTDPKLRLVGPEKISEAQFEKTAKEYQSGLLRDRELNGVVFKLAAERNLPMVDLWKTAASFPRTDEYWSDAVHFSKKGFGILAEELVLRIRETSKLPEYQGKPFACKTTRSMLNMMFNTFDNKHPRVFAVGGNVGSPDALRKSSLKDVANCGYWIMSFGYEHPSYMECLDYAASLLSADLVLYNPPSGESDDIWKQNFSKAFSILRKGIPKAKIALVMLPGNAKEINDYMRGFAASNKAFVIETNTAKTRFDEKMLGEAARQLLDMPEPKGKVMNSGSELGPDGAIR